MPFSFVSVQKKHTVMECCEDVNAFPAVSVGRHLAQIMSALSLPYYCIAKRSKCRAGEESGNHPCISPLYIITVYHYGISPLYITPVYNPCISTCPLALGLFTLLGTTKSFKKS